MSFNKKRIFAMKNEPIKVSPETNVINQHKEIHPPSHGINMPQTTIFQFSFNYSY
jgi:hypothetical protein